MKQGDPLSTVLFNSTLDPIIKRINDDSARINISGQNMAILGFADDMVIINKDAAIAQRQLTTLSDFFAQLGMGLSIGKCSTFQICTANKSWYQVDPGLHVGLELVSYASSEKVIRYLGINLRPWTGLDRTTDSDIITGAGNNIAKMELKRHQRLELIRVYLLSRFIHGLVIILIVDGSTRKHRR